ncbi:MAG: HEPN domain-containing protein [Lachnospiraceae bacterium]|nr:HEPN domain-containing protein [Lachnospiraceae bacterium]
MDKNNRNALAKVRMDDAYILISDAKQLLKIDSYKSANNRAYYAIEKSLKALLALAGVDSETHKGVLYLFNERYIRMGAHEFDSDDYKLVQKAAQIRSASDYDDFYIANKEECVLQVQNAEKFFEKVKKYIEDRGL